MFFPLIAKKNALRLVNVRHCFYKILVPVRSNNLIFLSEQDVDTFGLAEIDTFVLVLVDLFASNHHKRRWTISSTRFSASLLSKMVSALSIPLIKN